MDKEIVKMARERADNYKKALKYLNGLKVFTLSDFSEVLKLAGVDMPETQIKQTWDQSASTLLGPEGLRKIYRETLEEGIKTFDEIASS